MKLKKFFFIICIMALGVFIVGCSNEKDVSTESNSSKDENVIETKTEDKEVIKIGTTSYFKDIVFEAEPIFEETSGYELEVIVFDDIITPNVALDEGSIDCNFYQYIPYLETFNKERDTDLVQYGEDYTNGIACTYGIFSKNIKGLDEVFDGATVGIANSTSTRAQTLKVLAQNNLIELKKDVEMPSQLDIISNPKKLKFIEMDGNKLISAMEDVDLVSTSSVYLLLSGGNPKSAIGIQDEEITESLADVLVVRKEDKNAEWGKYLEDALLSEHLIKFMDEELKGAYIPVTNIPIR